MYMFKTNLCLRTFSASNSLVPLYAHKNRHLKPIHCIGWNEINTTKITSAVVASITRNYTAVVRSEVRNTLSDGNFQLYKVKGDGACMFRSVVQGVHISDEGKPMSQSLETSSAQNLRQAVVAELRKNRSEIEPFLPGIADNFDEYLEIMSKPSAWGGEPELLMASNVVQRPICVYQLGDRRPELIVKYGDAYKAKSLHLLWSGNHYDVLVPRDPTY